MPEATFNVAPSTPTRISTAAFDPGRRRVHYRGIGTLYVGPDNTVSAATGVPVAAGAEEDFDQQTGEELWAFHAQATAQPVDVY